MKTKYIILAIILFFGFGGGLTFLLSKKKKDSKKSSPKAPVITPEVVQSKAVLSASTPQEPLVRESL